MAKETNNSRIRVLDANNDLDQIVFADWFNKNKPDDLKDIIEYDTRAIMFYATAYHEPYDADVIMVNGRMGIRTKIDDMRTDIDFMTPKQFIDEAYKTLSDRTKEYDTGDKNYRSASEENRKNTHIRIMLQDKDLLEYDLGMIDENDLLKRQRMGNLSFEKETNDFAKVAHFFDEQYDVAQSNIDNYERSIRDDYEEHEAHRAEQQDEKAEWIDADIAQDQVDFMDWYKDLNKRTADLEYIHSEEFISIYDDPIESMEAFMNGTDEERAEMMKEFREYSAEREIIKSSLHEVAHTPTKIDFTRENYDKFFPFGRVETPIESVKLGEHQFEKLDAKERQDILSLVHETLYTPDIVISEQRESVFGDMRDAHIYARSYQFGDKAKAIQSVVVSIENENISISSHKRDISNVVNKIKTPEQIMYVSTEVGRVIEQRTQENAQLIVNPTRVFNTEPPNPLYQKEQNSVNKNTQQTPQETLQQKYDDLHAKVYEHCTVNVDDKKYELKEGLLNGFYDVRKELDQWQSMTPKDLRKLANDIERQNNKNIER